MDSLTQRLGSPVGDAGRCLFVLLGVAVSYCFLRLRYGAGHHARNAVLWHALVWTWVPFWWKVFRRLPIIAHCERRLLTNSLVEGLSRSMTFVFHVALIALTYVFTPLHSNHPAEREAETARLRSRLADQALNVIQDLKGYYIKAAQTLCGAGLFPKEFNDAFGVLLDQCPREPYSKVKRIIESELRCSISEVFVSFQEEAVAAASIGQVHFAQLKNGTPVAVKVQYPEVERYFYMDVQAVRFVLGVAGMGAQVKDAFDKLQENMKQEFDYRREAAVMRECAENVMPEYGGVVVIPLPLDERHQASNARSLCSRKVLTMERLDGTPIRKHTMELLESFAGQFGSTVEELKALMCCNDPSKLDRVNPKIKQFLNMGSITERQSYGIRMAIKTRNVCYRAMSLLMRDCHCQPCNDIRPRLKPLPVPLNGPRIAKLLFDVHGYEIFQKGLFNSDAHAGNVLMMRDGRLGLIDYGACMRLTQQQRLSIARLFVAIANEDDDAVPPAFWQCGFKSKRMDRRLALLLAHVSFNRGPYPADMIRLAGKVGLPKNPSVMDIEAYVRRGQIDEIVEFPGHLVLLQRCCMVLSGVAMELGAGRLSSAGMLKPQALKLLKPKPQPTSPKNCLSP